MLVGAETFARISSYARQAHGPPRHVVHEVIAGAINFVTPGNLCAKLSFRVKEAKSLVPLIQGRLPVNSIDIDNLGPTDSSPVTGTTHFSLQSQRKIELNL